MSGGRVVIVGGGAWGTVLALLAGRTGRQVTILVRREEEARRLEVARRRDRWPPGIALPRSVRASADPAAACAGATVALFAVPTATMRAAAQTVAPYLVRVTVASAAKGLEPGSLMRMTEVLSEVLALSAQAAICALSGPNLAGEIAAGLPAATVVAGHDRRAVTSIRDALGSDRFRVYVSDDVVGVEFAGALKNVIAIGAGVGDGLGAGDNAKAAFITRGLAEMARLGVAYGANPLTFAGLAGLGDLVATCGSPLSRNRRFGQLLAEGVPPAEIEKRIGEVVEGVETTRAAVRLAERAAVELPIAAQLHRVLFDRLPPGLAIQHLMERETKDEMAGFFGIR